MTGRNWIGWWMMLLFLCATACDQGGGAAHQALCKRFCETAVSEVDACVVQDLDCHLESAAFSDYVKDCTDECIHGFAQLSSEEKPGVEECLTCVCDTITTPACDQITFVMDFDCDDECDEADIYEFNDYVGIDTPDDEDIDC